MDCEVTGQKMVSGEVGFKQAGSARRKDCFSSLCGWNFLHFKNDAPISEDAPQ